MDEKAYILWGIEMVTTNSISIYRGDDKTISLTVYKPDGTTPYPLTGCTVTLYIKRDITDANSDAAITLVATITDGAEGKCEFYFVPTTTDTSDLKNKKIYPYDIEVVTSSGKHYTVLRGSFNILQP